MKLTRLRQIGFKSFVEPTDFLIEPGLTGVVGPNGCGKSNLVEALRWVMGETSHKSMRAAEMDDIIFAGTNGFFDDLPVDQVREFEAELYKYVDATNPGLLRTIMEKKVLDDALKAEMSKVIKQSKEAFVADRQTAAK